MSLNLQQAQHCAKVFEDYFGNFNRIDEYMREQKLNALAEMPFALPGCGPEEDLFSDFTMSPQDMEFEVVELESPRWQLYLDNFVRPENENGKHTKLCLRNSDVILPYFFIWVEIHQTYNSAISVFD